MTRYAVGDLQGCLKPLQYLLRKVQFDRHHDQLWLVGDIINRGPDSLGALRFIKDLGDCIRLVLGNHELHFLAVATGIRSLKKLDTFTDILQANECQDYIEWLCQQPLLYTDPSGDYTMVHAGIPPQWTLAQAQQYASEVANALQRKNRAAFLQHMYGDTPDCWHDDLQGWERLRVITNYLTRMRFCAREGKLDLQHKAVQHHDAAMLPWFMHSNRQIQQHSILFGHWAALKGEVDLPYIHALDTACVWGHKLTLMNLENGQHVSCPFIQ